MREDEKTVLMIKLGILVTATALLGSVLGPTLGVGIGLIVFLVME